MGMEEGQDGDGIKWDGIGWGVGVGWDGMGMGLA